MSKTRPLTPEQSNNSGPTCIEAWVWGDESDEKESRTCYWCGGRFECYVWEDRVTCNAMCQLGLKPFRTQAIVTLEQMDEPCPSLAVERLTLGEVEGRRGAIHYCVCNPPWRKPDGRCEKCTKPVKP